MALSGDIEVQELPKTVGIRSEVQIWFTDDGQVTHIVPNDEDIMFSEDLPEETISELTRDRSKHHLRRVIQVVNGDIEDAFPLIGHRMMPWRPDERGLEDMMTDGVLTATEEVNEQIKALGPRNPASLLVVHENHIYGVVVDEKNECQVVGRVSQVVPKRVEDKDVREYNTVVVGGEDDSWTVVKSKAYDLKKEVAEGLTFCMVSEGGYAYIEGNPIPDENIRELVLIGNQGYIFFREVQVEWTRLMIGLRIDEFATRTTRILKGECLVSHRGAFLRNDDRIQVLGSGNAVLDFEAFIKFLEAFGTTGVPKERQPKPRLEGQEEDEQESSGDKDGLSVEDGIEELEDSLEAMKLSVESDETGEMVGMVGMAAETDKRSKDESSDSDLDNSSIRSPDSIS